MPSGTPTTKFWNGAIMSKSFQLSVAPEKLWQAINPWILNLAGGQFGIVNIDLGQTHEPETERAILDQVGSYGRQLGRIGDALEVLLRHINQDELSDAEQDTLDILKGQLAEIRKIKQQKRAEAQAGLTSPGSSDLSPSRRP